MGHPKPFNRRLVDLDAKPGGFGQRDMAIAQRQRPPHQIMRKIEVRQAHAPVDRGDRAGKMNGGRAGEARFRDLGRDIDLEAQPLAESGGVERRRESAELDQLERDAARAGQRMRLDIGQRVDALVDPDRQAAARERLQAGEIMRR